MESRWTTMERASQQSATKRCTALLKHGNQRMYLTDEEKVAQIQQQDFKYSICGDKLSYRNAKSDHVSPLCATIGEQVFQAVHPYCHSRKTAEEERPLDEDQLTSHVSLAARKQFIDALPPQTLMLRILRRRPTHLESAVRG